VTRLKLRVLGFCLSGSTKGSGLSVQSKKGIFYIKGYFYRGITLEPSFFDLRTQPHSLSDFPHR
jgi:hypothetical protein